MIAEGALINSRYRLDQPIGHGRAGMVWLAFDTKLHRTVTAKCMYIQDGLEPAIAANARALALREARAACQVVDDCAITVHDAFDDGADVWLIMEYVPSRSMDEFLAEYGRLTVEQTATLGAQLAAALATAHAVGVVHGSLEPANVLLADDGGVKVTDFGISAPGASVAYRAPELAAGHPASPASDAYSLGATLYATVEGSPPFGEDGQAAQAPPTHAGVLTGALLKLLRIDPSARPTLPDTITALNAIGAGDEAAAVPDAAPTSPHAQPPQQSTVPAAPQQDPPGPPAPGSAPQGSAQAPEHLTQPAAAPPDTTIRASPAPRADEQRPRQGADSPARAWLVAGIAILAAVAVGVLFTELLFL